MPFHPLPPRLLTKPCQALVAVLIAAGSAACGSPSVQREGPADGSFGFDNRYPPDASMDGGASSMDAGSAPAPVSLRVRFTHAIPNTGTLSVCHDPDGPGPMAAVLLRDETRSLRAEYGTRSATLLVPAIESGELTLQHEPRVASAPPGLDGGSEPDDGGGPQIDPCDPSLREATIALPLTSRWLDPRDPASGDELLASELLPTVSGVPALTLLGSGLGLDEDTLGQRTQEAYDSYLQARPEDTLGALDHATTERAALQAAFGPRVLIQRDVPASDAQRFSLSVFHAVADVAPADATLAERQVGAVRLCMTAGTRESSALPQAPAPAIPFRLRKLVGNDFDPKLSYEFRVFAQRDIDPPKQDCATTGAMPIARTSYAKFEPGKSYTLAVIGAIAPAALCSANAVSLVRASCQRPAAELAARIQLLEDD